jgi:hypothetical protein
MLINSYRTNDMQTMSISRAATFRFSDQYIDTLNFCSPQPDLAVVQPGWLGWFNEWMILDEGTKKTSFKGVYLESVIDILMNKVSRVRFFLISEQRLKALEWDHQQSIIADLTCRTQKVLQTWAQLLKQCPTQAHQRGWVDFSFH